MDEPKKSTVFVMKSDSIDDSKKSPKATEVDLDEFLDEMTSIVKNKFDQQARTIDGLEKRITSLENRKSPELIIEEKLSGVTKSISNIGERLISLEKKINTLKTVSTELLRTLTKEETKKD